MGTFYHLHSKFKAVKATGPDSRFTAEKIEAKIAELFKNIPGELKPCVEIEDGAVIVEIQFSDCMTYGTAEDADALWFDLVKELADFSEVVVCHSSGDDYEDGEYMWYIGPRKLVRAAELAEVKAEIEAKRIKLEILKKKIVKKPDEIISSSHGE